MGVTTEASGAAQAFDLNIEKVLEHWTVPFAIRELIANALDEQALTGTSDPEIYKDSAGCWHIRDAGRGLRYERLTQNENAEKRRHPHVIGQFGMGLKDAVHVDILDRCCVCGPVTVPTAVQPRRAQSLKSPDCPAHTVLDNQQAPDCPAVRGEGMAWGAGCSRLNPADGAVELSACELRALRAAAGELFTAPLARYVDDTDPAGSRPEGKRRTILTMGT